MWPIKIRRSYTYNNGNELLTQNGTSFSYDANGNMVSKTNQCGTTTYQYDSENRLIGINGFKPDCSLLTASFKYDPFGRRIEKNVNDVITRYVYDREDMLFELDASGNIVTEYLHGPGIDEPIAMIKNNQIYYYHADGLGSIIAITDSVGNVVQRYEYDSFGNITYQQDANFKQPYTYTGREYDNESGLYYYRARYYDSKTGRFISEDLIGYSGGDINLYVYVANSPLNWRDPFGLEKVCIKKLMLVTAYNDIGPGSDWPYYKPKKKGDKPGSVGPGTVAVANSSIQPYPYGSTVTVYGPNGSKDYTGEVHDTGAGWDSKHHNVPPSDWIDIWLPGDQAKKWGKQWREVEVCYEKECEKK